ncbi:MAG: hypothetical protein JNK16_05320 [Phycisphaerales bacterium]|nr:hypothetical protein [Phycisphaerales bacterium]
MGAEFQYAPGRSRGVIALCSISVHPNPENVKFVHPYPLLFRTFWYEKLFARSDHASTSVPRNSKLNKATPNVIAIATITLAKI